MKYRKPVSALDGPPMRDGEFLELVTDSFTLELGHQLRGHRCILCSQMVGGVPVRVVTVIPVTAPECACGNIETGAFLICASHELPPSGELSDLVMARAMLCGRQARRTP